MERVRLMVVLVLVSVLGWSVMQVSAAESAGCKTINANYSKNWNTLPVAIWRGVNPLTVGTYQLAQGEQLKFEWEVTFKDGKPVAVSTGRLQIVIARRNQHVEPPSTAPSVDGTGTGTVYRDVTKLAAEAPRAVTVTVSFGEGVLDTVASIRFKLTCTPVVTVSAPTEEVEPTAIATEDAPVEPTEVAPVEPTAVPTEEAPVDPTLEPTVEPTEVAPVEPTSVPTEEVPVEPTPEMTEAAP